MCQQCYSGHSNYLIPWPFNCSILMKPWIHRGHLSWGDQLFTWGQCGLVDVGQHTESLHFSGNNCKPCCEVCYSEKENVLIRYLRHHHDLQILTNASHILLYMISYMICTLGRYMYYNMVLQKSVHITYTNYTKFIGSYQHGIISLANILCFMVDSYGML